VDSDRELIRLGGTPTARDLRIGLYKCVETGLEPESKEPKS